MARRLCHVSSLTTSLLALALGGCATTGPEESRPLAVVADGSPETVARVNPSDGEPPGDPQGDGEDDPELSEEDFELGFCVDDIYAKHLTAQFKAEHRGDKPTPRPRASRRRSSIDSSTFRALSYARDRMNGKTTPFFGAIPIVVNDEVDFWVQYFKTSGRRQFMSWLVRGESVKQMVQPLLKDAGIPMEFFYLAMVESGFSNSAYSRARATGTWQFMKGTAQLYGLKINHWVDERRDPVKSTLAAATLLKDLYADLGDWYLAMAAYNAGPGKVRKAIRQTKSRDFWAIAGTPHLAKETKQYVPKVLAAILLATESNLHGFDVQSNPLDSLPESEVLVRRPVLLDELAQKLGVSRRLLSAWNPELIRDITPPGKQGYPLRLPQAYANAYPAIEKDLSVIEVTDIHMHTVKSGDTLSRIARQYKVAIKQIMSVNPGVKAARLRPGHTIAIPIPGVVSVGKSPDNMRL